MPLEVKQFNCPKCSTPLDLKNAGRSKSIVCASCGSQIDLTTPEYNILGNAGAHRAPQITPFKLGMRGNVQGQEFEIIGRVVYKDDEGDVWDEWLLLSAVGQYVWITDSENQGMALWHSFVPVNPVEPDSIELDQSFGLRTERVTVRDTGKMRIEYLEGELTWKSKAGDTVKYAEADSEHERISIEYTSDQIEFYWGEDLDRQTVAKAFGIVQELRQAGIYRDNKGKNPVRRASTLGQVVFWMIVIACIILGIIFGNSDGSSSSSSSGGYSSGSSIRSSGSSGRSPSGGGSSRSGGK